MAHVRHVAVVEGGQESSPFQFNATQGLITLTQKEGQTAAYAFDDVRLTTSLGKNGEEALTCGDPDSCDDGGGQHDDVVLIHGTSKAAVLNVFEMVITGRVARLVTAAQTEGSRSSTSVCYSIGRHFSWGSTDVLHQDGAASQQCSAFLAQGGRPHGVPTPSQTTFRVLDGRDPAELAAFATTLQDCAQPSYSHAVLCVSLWALNAAASGDETPPRVFRVCLLPRLRRVNRVLRHVLLNWRSTWLKEASWLQSPLVPYFAVGQASPGSLTVLTVLDPAPATVEESRLCCWFGCRTVSGAGECDGDVFAATPSRPSRLSSELPSPAIGSSSVSHSPQAPPATAVETRGGCSGAVATLHASAASSETARRLSMDVADADGEVPTLHENSLGHVRPGERSSTATTCTCDTSAALLRERARLEAEVRQLREEIQELHNVKKTVEKEVTQVLLSTEEALQDLEAQEDGMLRELRRAQSILKASETAALTQEGKMIRRLTDAFERFSSVQPERSPGAT